MSLNSKSTRLLWNFFTAPSHYKFSRLNQIFYTQLWRNTALRLYLLSGLEYFWRINEPQNSHISKLAVFGIITWIYPLCKLHGIIPYANYVELSLMQIALWRGSSGRSLRGSGIPHAVKGQSIMTCLGTYSTNISYPRGAHGLETYPIKHPYPLKRPPCFERPLFWLFKHVKMRLYIYSMKLKK